MKIESGASIFGSKTCFVAILLPTVLGGQQKSGNIFLSKEFFKVNLPSFFDQPETIFATHPNLFLSSFLLNADNTDW